MSYMLAPSLAQLRSEVNTTWPGRDRTSDGWIGDASHSARKSDHNPNARGRVDALDIDHDGIDDAALIKRLCSDPRTNYVIHDGRIYSRIREFRPIPYHGPNPHRGHVHVSIRQARAAEDDRRSWGVAALAHAPAGTYSRAIHSEVQRRMGRPVDGRLGAGDLAALCTFLGLPAYSEVSNQPRTAWAVGDAIVPGIWEHDPKHKGNASIIVRCLEAYVGATIDRGAWGPELSALIAAFMASAPNLFRPVDRSVALARTAEVRRASGL